MELVLSAVPNKSGGYISIVKIEGTTKLDREVAASLKEKLVHFAVGCSRMVLLLDNIDYLDSAAVCVIVEMQEFASKLGGDIKLVAPKFNVSILLELMNLHRVFDICNTQEDAVSNF
jgi:anti-sigma B factor antagonist